MHYTSAPPGRDGSGFRFTAGPPPGGRHRCFREGRSS
nr:hypothetical protein [Streptomyces himastatinicus]